MFRRTARIFCLAVFALGVVLRLSIRDQVDGLAVVFYATPWPVLAAVAVAAAIAWMGRKRIAVVMLVAAIASVIAWVQSSWLRNDGSAAPQDFRVVSWNAEHPKQQLPEVIATARGFGADILGITETESTAPADVAAWKSAFPGHSVQTLPGFMLFITRGKVARTFTGSLADRGRHNVIELELDGKMLNVVFADFHANPLRSRRAAFDALEGVLNGLPDRPTILFADFNTPRESVHFEPLRRRMRDAFETRGAGMSETWPVPVPLLSLDHIWVGGSLKILRGSHGWTSISDHRPVIADLGWW